MKDKQINSVGFLMDGNRRWAVENGFRKTEGHKHGALIAEKVIYWAMEEDIENIIFYTLSTENWQRKKNEINILLTLLKNFLEKRAQKIIDKNVSLRFVGDLKRFPKRLEKLMLDLQERSRNNKYKAYFAISYGGRLEIVEAIKKMSQELTKKEITRLTESRFEKFMWTAELPDPEILIRTGGHKRLSNFLTWKSTYSEIIFLDTKWPAFSKKEFKKILQNYRKKIKINKGK